MMQKSGTYQRWFVVLLIILISTGCAVQHGRMADTDYMDYSVPVEESAVYAAVALIETHITSMHPLTEQEADRKGWAGAALGEPLTLYDVNTQPLFHIFPVKEEMDVIGKIWVSANKLVGAAVPVIEIGGQYGWLNEDIKQTSFTRLVELTAEIVPDREITWLDFVCYSYPKIGAMAVVRRPESQEEKKLVVDIGNLDLIADPEEVLPEQEREYSFGMGPWISFLDAIPEDSYAQRLGSWSDDDQWAKQLASQLREAGVDITTYGFDLSEDQWQIAKELILSLTTFDMWVAKTGLPAPSGVDAFCQEQSYWCSVATASMIAAYYNVAHSQTHIATYTNSGASSGTDPNDMRKYYRDDLSTGGLGKKNSEAYIPDWSRVKKDIKNDMPVHTCTVPIGGGVGHCRAAFGIKEYQKKVGSKTVTTKMLGVVDPWPTSWSPSMGCGEKWEDYDAMYKGSSGKKYKLFYHVYP